MGSELDFLAGGGEMAQRIRAFDWGSTPLGPSSTWSPALLTMIRFMLANRFPHILWWGPEYVQFYNDPYRPIPGAKHPDFALGKPASRCWSEIWHVIGPLIDTPFRGGPATWDDDILLEINRHGYLEESHFTIAYSPVPDPTAPSGIGGVLATVHEITGEVIGKRRVATLRDLGSRAGEAKSAVQACVHAAATLAIHAQDIPFLLLYLIDESTHTARLSAAAGVPVGEKVSPLAIDLGRPAPGAWPLNEAIHDGSLHVMTEIGSRFRVVPAGPWSDPPDTAVLLPIPGGARDEPVGFMVSGVSARLKLNEDYREFYRLVCMQIASAIGNARAYEAERQRAEKLAAIDRAKTVFFSNVSHEFRTPLTLMLGPMEDLLRRATITSEVREQVEIMERNGQRLLRLVNTLLEFSRIEAGRLRAHYLPVDLAAITADLASVFRAAIERAGLAFVVHCPDLGAPVFVDRAMWEKIVLNLLSNALKFTFDGRITVTLRARGDRAQLVVEDTGTGITPAEMPRLFERFHRIENAKGRTHEGSGIGLALVQELVKLHGGTIRAESTLGRGTTFTVALPFGREHLPQGRIGDEHDAEPAEGQAGAFVQEALQWLPAPPRDGADDEPEIEEAPIDDGDDGRPLILVADDNADMRRYIVRLLGDRYRVHAVADGEAALAVARANPPALVLADVMMPRLDGFGLLRGLRADATTRSVPVIMVSARAGEESRVDGMEAGADDYLVKPFSARELNARIAAHIAIAAERRGIRQTLEDSNRRKDEFMATLAHELRNPLAPIRNGLRILQLAKDDATAADEARDMMERQVAHMVRLVDDLMDVSRINRGKIVLRRSRVPLSEPLGQALETSRPAIEERGHALAVEIGEEALFVFADATRIAQVFANILNNAAKYMEPKGSITVKVVREGATAVVRVRDTGIGIPEAMLPRVFDMFTQADGALERAQGGLGVGLSLVKNLVEMHGGTVEATSPGRGRGSEFVVRLPLAPAEQRACIEGSARTPAFAPRRRVLIVDDNRDAAVSLAKLLELMGNDTRTAYDGLEALDAAVLFRPDLVMLDIGMPRLNGLDTARKIRGETWGRDVALVALTGWGQTEDRRRSIEAGFDSHLVKPVEPEELIRLLGALRFGNHAAPPSVPPPSGVVTP